MTKPQQSLRLRKCLNKDITRCPHYNGGNPMANLKYANCLVHEPGPFPLELEGKTTGNAEDPIPGIKATHLMTADDSVIKDFFSVDCTWLWSGAAKEPSGEPHTHDFSQVIGLIGGHPDDPHDLGGEITVWLDGNKEVITRSVLIFVPAGVVHGPILFNKINQRVFFITIAMTGQFSRTSVAAPQEPAPKKRYKRCEAGRSTTLLNRLRQKC